MLEKAWAKIYGSYYKMINAPTSFKILRELSGAPTYHNSIDSENLFEQVDEAIQKEQIVAVTDSK